MSLKQLRNRAMFGDKTILDDFTDQQLETELDDFGWTAYHILAQGRKKEILKFPAAFKLRNKAGETAVDILLKNFEIDREVLENFFPWYSPESEEETIEDSIKKIKETSSAEKFILSIGVKK